MESTGISFWSDAAAECGVRGGHLNVGHRENEYSNLNPATINQVVQFSITAEVLSGLVQLNQDLVPVPDLAKGWDISDDLLTYTFSLRDDAKFHTGRQFTADDVVYTYDHQLAPDTQSIHTKGLEGVNRPVKIDDFTVEISTAVPRASFLTKVVERASGRVMTIVDKETIAEVGEGGFNRKPVGVGPFRIDDHVFGEKLELSAARDTYYDSGVPCLDNITMYNITEGNTLVAALKTGELDFIYEFAPQFWDELDSSSEIIVDTTPDVGFQMLSFNVRPDREEKTGLVGPQPWDDINIIHAMGSALDREEFIRRAFQGRAIPAYGPIPPGQKFFFEDLSGISSQAYDLERAKQLMAESDYPDGFEVTVITAPGNRTVLEALGGVLKENINVTLIPDIQDNSILQPKTANGEVQAELGGSGGDPDPDDAIDDWFAAGSKFNDIGYDDEVVNRLNFQQKTQPDPEKRKEIILELNRRLSETCPCVFTHHNINRAAYTSDMKGYLWIHALRQFGSVWLDR
jgi:ABC-type transport system substrate-binding protein